MKKIFILLISVYFLSANICDTKKFTINIPSNANISIKDFIGNISDECHLNITFDDNLVENQLNKKLSYIKARNISLDKLLYLILSKNNIFYNLDDDILELSYIKTKTFKIDYVISNRSGSSSLSTTSGDESSAGSNISSNYQFTFWDDFTKNINAILQESYDNFKAPAPIIDKTTSMITVTGTKRQLNKIKRYINHLNKNLHKQVLIDVKIYSVYLSQSNRTGINWSNFSLFANGNNNLSGTITKSTASSSMALINSLQFSLSGVLNFLAQYGTVKSISNPKIATLNNQKALISVGNTINYLKTQVYTDQNGNVVQNQQPANIFVGILLDVTPEIGDDKSVILRINPSISELTDPTQLLNISRNNLNLPPDTTQKTISTVVKIKDGQTLILGGLITDNNAFNKNGVNGLKEVPIINYLFSNKEKITNRKELVFIITPHILNANQPRTLKDIGYHKSLSLSNFEGEE